MFKNIHFITHPERLEIESRLVSLNKAENNTFRTLFNLIKEKRLYTKVSGSIALINSNITMQQMAEYTLYELKQD